MYQGPKVTIKLLYMPVTELLFSKIHPNISYDEYVCHYIYTLNHSLRALSIVGLGWCSHRIFE